MPSIQISDHWCLRGHPPTCALFFTQCCVYLIHERTQRAQDASTWTCSQINGPAVKWNCNVWWKCADGQ